MSELKLDKIIEEINRYFDRHCQYVFWYDPESEFADDISFDNKALMTSLNSQLLIVGKDEQFETKLKLLDTRNRNKNYLIYIKASRPELRQNYLADMERYGCLFEAKAGYVIFQQLDDQLNWNGEKKFQSFVNRYLKYFRAKKRRKDFIQHFDQRLNEHPEYIILSNLAGLSRFDENELLIAVLNAGMDEVNNKIIQLFSKYGVLPIFWQIYEDYFGSSQLRTLDDIIKGVVITSIYSQLKKHLPAEFKKYKFENYSNDQVFMKRFSDSHEYSRLFLHLTTRVWNDCQLETYMENEDLQQLLKIRGIKQVDEILLDKLRNNFQDDGTIIDGDETIQIIVQLLRRPETSNSKFAFLREAYYVLMYKPRYFNNWSEMLKNYATEAYRIDSFYRNLVNHYNAINEMDRGKYQRIKRIVDTYYYNQVLNQSISEWNNNFNLSDVPPNQRQEHFYKNIISEISERVVVIISDAFRYEAAKELEQKLARDDRITTDMKHLLTCLPSVTYMGMPLLLPHNQLSWKDGNVLVDGQLANNSVRRRKILKQLDQNNDVLELNSILKASSKEVKAMIANKHVIYVYHNHIDAIGDNQKTENNTFKATNEAIGEIRSAVQTLRTNGVSHIVVTADHGFIYHEMSVKEQNKIDISAKEYDGKIAPRYLITKNELPKIPGVCHTTLGQSLETIDTTNIYYPRTVSVFKSLGGKNYVHGGSSLQEMVIPVLDMKMNSSKSKAEFAAIKLAATRLSINALRMTLRFNQVEPISDMVKPQKFNIYFVDNFNRIISNVSMINADRSKDTINIPLLSELDIQNQHYNRNENYYLIVQPLEGTVKSSRYIYTMDLINYDN